MYTAVLHRNPGRILKSAENLGEIEKSESRVIIFTQDVCSDFVTQRVTRLRLKKKTKQTIVVSVILRREINPQSLLSSALHCPSRLHSG